MMARRLLGVLGAVALGLAGSPALAQAAPVPNCAFQFGFAQVASLIPDVVGTCVSNAQASNPQGDTMQETANGLLTWTKATNVVEFTTGERTWVYSGYGLILRDGATSYDWEGTTSLVAGIAINKAGQVIDPLTGKVIPTDAHVRAG
jgi:hypothetical protein